jgi:hypothetical protein
MTLENLEQLGDFLILNEKRLREQHFLGKFLTKRGRLNDVL